MEPVQGESAGSSWAGPAAKRSQQSPTNATEQNLNRFHKENELLLRPSSSLRPSEQARTVMTNQLLVIDDDEVLVKELRDYLDKSYPSLPVVCPPELHLNLSDVRANIAGASAIVLDRNIAGIDTFGQTLLKGFRHKLKGRETPVIVWSKYLRDTVVFEPAGIFKLTPNSTVPYQAIEEKSLGSVLLDYKEEMAPFRALYRNTRAFVSKASPNPVELLCDVLKRLGVIAVLRAAEAG